MPEKAKLVKLSLGDTLIWRESEVLSRGERARRVRTALERLRGRSGSRAPGSAQRFDDGEER